MNKNPNGLPKKDAGEKCNARTSSGKYCGNESGKGTDHLGEGRCVYHGGTAGRPIMNGFYSNKVKKNLRDQLEEIVSDPQFSTMLEEFAQLKLILGNLLGGLSEDFGENMFRPEKVICPKCGEVVVERKNDDEKRVETMIRLVDKLSQVHKRIIETSIMANKVITMDQLQYLYRKIAEIILEATKSEKVSDEVFEKLQEIPLFFKG